MTKSKPTAARTKPTTDTTTRNQRNLVRKARTLKGPELKAFVAKHREDIKAVAAATNRRKVAAEAQKLLKGN